MPVGCFESLRQTMKHDLKKPLYTAAKCPRCGGSLKESFVTGYKFFCPRCYEDFYGFEVGWSCAAARENVN